MKPESPAKPSPPAASKAPAATVAPAPPSPADVFQSCLAQMRGAGMEFQAQDKVTEGRCTLEGAVALHAVATPSGKVELPARLACSVPSP